MLKGYLVVDDVSLEEAKDIISKLKKKGRWISFEDMMKLDSAASFAILTHGFRKAENVVELGEE